MVGLVRFVSFFAGLSSIVVRIDTESFLMMTNLLSTHRFQILGGTFEVGRTEPYNKNFLHQNSGHPLIFKPTLSIRPLTMIVHGITSVKLEDVFLTRKKNTSGMSRTILKDPRAVATTPDKTLEADPLVFQYQRHNWRPREMYKLPPLPTPTQCCFGRDACLYKSCCLQNSIERREGGGQILFQ